MKYKVVSKIIELREDGLWRKARVGRDKRRLKEGRVEGTGTHSDGYSTVTVNGRNELYHRVVACLAFKMDIPPGIQIDHRDGNPTNNSPDNLRLVTNRENSQNRDKHRAGKLVGACFNKKRDKWEAKIRLNGKQYHLCYRDTELEAHEAYLKAFALIQWYPTELHHLITGEDLRAAVQAKTTMSLKKLKIMLDKRIQLCYNQASV